MKLSTVKVGKYQESLVGSVPVVEQYLDLRDKVFAIADELGLGEEVREIYYAASLASQAIYVGGPILASWLATTPAIAGSGAAAFGVAGGAVAGAIGIAVVAIVLFSGGGDEDRARRQTEHARDIAKRALKKLDLSGFIKEQQAAQVVANLDLGAFKKPDKKLAKNAHKLELFYLELGKQLSPLELKIFLCTANVTRWQSYRSGIAATTAGRKMLIVAAEPAIFAKLDKQIADESAKLAQLEAELKAQQPKAKANPLRLPPRRILQFERARPRSIFTRALGLRPTRTLRDPATGRELVSPEAEAASFAATSAVILGGGWAVWRYLL